MKIWLDDIRLPPDDTWTWCKTVASAQVYFHFGSVWPIEVISFDHDLGDNVPTGYDLAKYIEANCATGKNIMPKAWAIHSANPVGRENIRKAMESAERFLTSA